MSESSKQFENRKRDHIQISLENDVQAVGGTGLDQIDLIHEAIPHFNFNEISLQTNQKFNFSSPIFISSMTAGHNEAENINFRLAQLASRKNWLMGVGSQRKELFEPTAKEEWIKIKKQFPDVKLASNVGITQLSQYKTEQILELVHNIGAMVLFVHTNPLQEALQPEGTPQFKDCLTLLKKLIEKSPVPVVLKEVGCGFSESTLERLTGLGLYAIDSSGYGGTHWGRIETKRLDVNSTQSKVGQSFSDWGISTVESTLNAVKVKAAQQVWASGGVRSGLDVAKLLALGASMVGIAQPFLKAALHGEEELAKLAGLIEAELKVAMFCTGVQKVDEFSQKRVWKWKKN